MSNLSAPLPANNPCGSCPYRRNVPSGVWDASEYEKLPRYDAPTTDQPARLFLCHQQDGRICAGWAGCHDMDHNLAARVAVLDGQLTPDEHQQLLDYTTDVPLFDRGQDAADHGRADESNPGQRARQMARKLRHRQKRQAQDAGPSVELDQI
ncbi:DUF6283 family protein [Promicromonospora sukumoe]|uniref:DUF6283 family protein n=1 Tax=Promicromonospora sukumoe TaxID=88382 RepID=UPI0037C5D457